jgi:hypothetical protein
MRAVDEDQWTIVLDLEKVTLWELLHEHLGRDAMWKAIAGWKKVLAAHIAARVALKTKAVDLLEGETSLEVERHGQPRQQSHIDSLAVKFFYQSALSLALGIQDTSQLPERMNITDDGFVRLGNHPLAQAASGKAKDCMERMISALDALRASDVAQQVKATYRDLQESTAKGRRAVEEISLLGLVPGRCRACSRLGA